MGRVVHEAGKAPRAVAPSQTRSVFESWSHFDAELIQVGKLYVLVNGVDDRSSRGGNGLIFQIVGAGLTDIEGPDVAQIPVIAPGPVHAVDLVPALVEGAAVIQPIDQRLGVGRNRAL